MCLGLMHGTFGAQWELWFVLDTIYVHKSHISLTSLVVYASMVLLCDAIVVLPFGIPTLLVFDMLCIIPHRVSHRKGSSICMCHNLRSRR